MLDEIKIDTIEWSAPEYSYKEKDNDWFWAIGLITIISCGVSIWFNSYLFAIFIFLSGSTLIMFTMREPQEVTFIIENEGVTLGRELYSWENIKSFNVKNNEKDIYAKLLIETRKHFLPIYTLPVPKDKIVEIIENLQKIIPRSKIEESQSMLFMEKLGF